MKIDHLLAYLRVKNRPISSVPEIFHRLHSTKYVNAFRHNCIYIRRNLIKSKYFVYFLIIFLLQNISAAILLQITGIIHC